MAKRAGQFNLPILTLDRTASVSLSDQIYAAIARAILEEGLKPGTRLPSTRMLAGELTTARNTVSAAFERLRAEGYIESRVGSGTRVSACLPDDLRLAQRVQPYPTNGHRLRSGFSRRGNLLARLVATVAQPSRPGMALSHGTPSVDLFPVKLWRRMVADRISPSSRSLFGYGEPAGYRSLRKAIAAYVGEARAVRAEEEQVIVVSGSQQAFDLVARMLLDPGARVLVEEPGYRGARAALLASGARPYPIGIDEQGMKIETAPRARAAYVTPSHQFPLGPTMSLARRVALLRWAQRSDAWIFEDDYDGEYCHVGRPLAALQGLDNEGRVIYISSFSKVLFPALRLGFVVVPPHLTGGFAAAIALADRHAPTIEQAALADFINEGHFARHLRRMRVAYAQRRSALLEATDRHLKGLVEMAPSEAGMHSVGWLPEGVDDVEVARRAAQERIGVSPLSAYYSIRPRRGGLVLGYSDTVLSEIEGAVLRLAKIVLAAIRSTDRSEAARYKLTSH